MELLGVEITESAHGPGRVRLVGEVKYASGAREQLWFDFPRRLEHELSLSGNPWLDLLIPLAVTLNEPLCIRLPVDVTLLGGVRELNRIWRCWYPDLPLIAIDAETAADTPPAAGERTAAFFSGGLDSWFTVLRARREAAPGTARIDDLITVWGFDVPIENTQAGHALFQRHQGIAEALGCEFVGVATNLRTTRWGEAAWDLLAHGPALGGIGLTLEPRYRNILIAATGGYRDLHYWASHPLTDPLLSSSATTFRHDGAAYTRVEKTRLLVNSGLAMQSLRVCWRSRSTENCGNCNKCYRTMLMLELLGALERCTTFGAGRVDLRRAGRIYCGRPWDYRELRDIEQLALASGRPDVATAARKSMQRSRRLTPQLERIRYFRRWGKTWRWSKRAEQFLLQNWLV